MENENGTDACDIGPGGDVCPVGDGRASSTTIAENVKQQKYELRDYQREIIDQIDRVPHPLVPLPTGGGKTVIAGAYIERAVAAGKRVLFVVHRRELVLQASQRLLAYGVDHAVLMGEESSVYLGQPVVVASIQTLHARAFRSKRIELPPADIIFIDEAHHARAETYMQVCKAYPGAKRIGLTATPARGDGRGLGGDLFSDLVPVPTYAWLIQHGYLVKPIVYAPVRPDLTGIRTLGTGDYSPGQLEDRMNTTALVGGIVEHWFKLGQNRQTICFTVGVKQSIHIRDEFRAAGVATEHIDANTPREDRACIIKAFKAGDVRILTNCAVFGEGFDEPSASGLILARPTKLMTLYRQMCGRVLRPWPGKIDARILDHSGAVFPHGYPDDDIAWVLSDDDRAVNKSAAARHDLSHKGLCECPQCGAVRTEGEPCVACGWKPEVKPKILEVQEGDLGEVRRDRSVHVLDQNHLRFYRELRHIEQQRSYKRGWAFHKFREKFPAAASPPWSWNDQETIAPSPATIAWVRSRAIAYARSRAAP